MDQPDSRFWRVNNTVESNMQDVLAENSEVAATFDLLSFGLQPKDPL